MKNKAKIIIPIALATAAVICAAAVLCLFYFGVLHFNNPPVSVYPVRGVDVSHYQGEIDWETLSKQGTSFAFVKATEGSSYVDPTFEKNRDEANKTGLRVGAYHFFNFESPGQTQAELFIKTVKKTEKMLPPAVDVELYGEYTADNIKVKEIKKELRALVDMLAEEYGVKPIIYTDDKTYELIVKDEFSDCDLWYRSVYGAVPDGIDWTFWQYSNRHVLDGYDGGRYIDMNVYSGSEEEFSRY